MPIHQTRCLWIDSICINQSDQTEKSIQVPLMGKIYTAATQVVIWLGESDDMIDEAMEAIPQLISKLEGFDGRLEVGLLNPALVKAGLPTSSSLVWKGITRLFSRSWFSRLWTFQEAVLPSKLTCMCGRNTVFFNSLSTLTKLLLASTVGKLSAQDQILGPMVAASYTKVMMIAMHREAVEADKPHLRDLYILLHQARAWSVSNPVDRIYGMLGLCDEVIKVDYSLSPAAVYSAYTKRHLMTDGILHLLHAASSNPPLRDLPSWCPNFDGEPKTSTLGGVAIDAGYCSGIGPNTLATYHVQSNEEANTISLTGFTIDMVDTVVPSSWMKYVSPGSPPTPIRSYDFDWEETCLKLSQTVYNKQGAIPTAHWRTLIANKDSKNKKYQIDGEKYYPLMKIMIAIGAKNHDFFERHPVDFAAIKAISAAENLALQDYVQALTLACRKRRFFSTKGGRIGLGPSSTRPGDLICIFDNGYTPFIIRPQPQPHNLAVNRFIGEAYVDGLMYGAALEAESRPEDRTFVLR